MYPHKLLPKVQKHNQRNFSIPRYNEVVFFDNSMCGLDRYLMDIGFSFLVNNMFFIRLFLWSNRYFWDNFFNHLYVFGVWVLVNYSIKVNITITSSDIYVFFGSESFFNTQLDCFIFHLAIESPWLLLVVNTCIFLATVLKTPNNNNILTPKSYQNNV